MSESLRDQLSANFDKIVTVPEVEAEPSAPAEVDTPAPSESHIADAVPAESKIGKPEATPAAPADDRPRRADGTFLSKEEAEKLAKDTKPAPVPSAAKVHPAKAPVAQAPAAAPAVAAAPAKPRPPRPSSWKKEHWDKWDTLDPALAEYLHTRESQFASGVSTYKAEVDAAKPIMEAMNQFIPELKQHNIEPTKWISELGNVHRMLALGTPQQKMQTLAHVAQAYGVPLQAFSDQSIQQQYLAQGQFRAPYQPPSQPQSQPLTREEAMKLWQEQFVQTQTQTEIERFAADTAKHPHYEEVRETMAGLLQANLAADLESAYAKALRMPEYEHLVAAERQQREQQEAEARKQAEQQRVAKARAKASSPASSTPSGPGAEDTPKGLRSQLSENFDRVMGGRV